MSVNKLKHIALKEIHYQLLNTALIINRDVKEYCVCWAFIGCRQRPTFENLTGLRNYCYICQLHNDFKPNRIERLRTIQQTWQLYLKLQKDLQNWKSVITNFTLYPVFWNKNYTDMYEEYGSHLDKKVAVREYINYCYEYLVWLDP